MSIRRRLVEMSMAPLRLVAYELLRRNAMTTTDYGILIHGFSDDTEAMVSKVRAAIDILAQHQPIAVSRLQRYVRAVVILDAGGPEYHSNLRLCIVSRPYIASCPDVQLASALAHEAAHARFAAAGIRYEGSAKTRIERACVRAQRRMERRLSGSSESPEHTVAAPWWCEQQLRARRASELRSLGTAPWLVRLYDRVRRFANGSE